MPLRFSWGKGAVLLWRFLLLACYDRRVQLSVLDLVPFKKGVSSADSLAETISLAQTVEALGYQRLWYAEHHNMPGVISTNAALLLARVGAVTTRIRLGAGGVMLPNYAPLQVVEAYHLLEAMFPGRIDLGIGRASGTDPQTALALRRNKSLASRTEFASMIDELLCFDHRTFSEEHPFARTRAMPDDVRLSSLWVLGSGRESAIDAAERGMAYAFAGHFSPNAAAPAMLAYREHFRPGVLSEPRSMLALSVVAADEHENAVRIAASLSQSLVKFRAGRPERLLSADEALHYAYSATERRLVEEASGKNGTIAGDVAFVRAALEQCKAATQADELLLMTHAFELQDRERSYELIARSFGLV